MQKSHITLFRFNNKINKVFLTTNKSVFLTTNNTTCIEFLQVLLLHELVSPPWTAFTKAVNCFDTFNSFIKVSV